MAWLFQTIYKKIIDEQSFLKDIANPKLQIKCSLNKAPLKELMPSRCYFDIHISIVYNNFSIYSTAMSLALPIY